jgi:non-specific serine/threonine protein kinase/serine/threonine-protein kinase
MSPEQALSSGEDIDTRTDVYSRGVIFYELLSGSPPLELRKIALDEFLRRLREEEPPTPSTKIRAQHPATSAESCAILRVTTSSKSASTQALFVILRFGA